MPASRPVRHEFGQIGVAAQATLAHMFGFGIDHLRVVVSDGRAAGAAMETPKELHGPYQYMATMIASDFPAMARYGESSGRSSLWARTFRSVTRRIKSKSLERWKRDQGIPDGALDVGRAVADSERIMRNELVWAASTALAEQLGQRSRLSGKEITDILSGFPLDRVREAANIGLPADVPREFRYWPEGAQAPEETRARPKGLDAAVAAARTGSPARGGRASRATAAVRRRADELNRSARRVIGRG
ncbi:hypothetical protein DFP74_1783 [Nocardiopsis sp. Huas11]|uniref:hypothetical protein n=1 Tax=Nocardiopsis sp. Huas11 TaxID=2183912 RepID=UPI000EB31E24|nr:hypothetical protein [Nocardiopsis sp. Huas11]RKS06159.1 hypothetical protein DFP74_1783 [Nocardiopsis sp. Huas11]